MRKSLFTISALLFIVVLFSYLMGACKKEQNTKHLQLLKQEIPDGFPPPYYSFQDNPLSQEGFELGRKLFYDGRLAIDNEHSCSSCHPEPIFTDYKFHNTGLPVDKFLKDYGRRRITGKKEDSLKFKPPTLHNTYISSNYMHDGRFNTLLQSINHYRSGVQQSTTLDPLLTNGITLTNTEATHLTFFLRTLTDSAFLKDPRFSKPQ